MHNAPPVAYPVGRFVWGMVLFIGVLLASAAGLAIWQWQSQAPSHLVWAAWVFWLICAALATYLGPRQVLSRGHLFWSGETWLWRGVHNAEVFIDEEQGHHLTVACDFGSGMLLLLESCHEATQDRGPVLCAWVTEQSIPSKWHGFRCAVYSRPRAITPPHLMQK